MDYKKMLDWLFAPADAYNATSPDAPPSMGALGAIHNAIDPVKAMGGYGNTVGAIFGGPGAKGFPAGMVKPAQTFEGIGATPSEVWRATGLHKAPEGNWRFEIPGDRESRLRVSEGQGAFKLGDVLDHPQLYEAYPELKDIKVTLGSHKPGGYWDASKNEIFLNENMTPENKRSVLLHEIQHAVQTLEGWRGAGTNSNRAEYDYNMAITNRFRTAKNAEEKNALERLHSQAYKKIPALGKELYMREAGENEARNVQRRMYLSDNGLQGISPWQSQDFKPDQQLLFGRK